MAFRHGAPASHKPHPAEKSTPVWLAIWRTWAGFANSQLLPDAAAGAPSRALSAESPVERQLFRTDFRFAPSLPQRFACGLLPFTRDMGVHGLCGRVPDSAGNVSPWIASAQTDANLSAHLHRLPTPPPYLRQMRLLPGRGRRYRVLDEAVVSQGRRRWMTNAAAGCSWRSSCKSPRTLPKCKCRITKQLTFMAVRGGINLSSPSTVLKANHLFIRHLCF